VSNNKNTERPFLPFFPIICKYPWEIFISGYERVEGGMNGDDIHVKIVPTSAEQQAVY
jgi:hypothetical protein